jgi:DNA-binding NtrC family response regulator
MNDATRSFLLSYDWPGNIRELENLIERAFLLSDSSQTLHVVATSASEPTHPTNLATCPQEESTERRAQPRSTLNYRSAKAQLVAAFDRRFLQKLMAECRGNVSAAARTAGKERRELGRLLRKYAIRPENFRG